METNTQLPTIEVPVDSIVVGDRVRKDFGDIDDLAQSIDMLGLIQPIVISYGDNKLIAGERRLRAHRKLGRTTIKVVYLQALDDATRTMLEATENIVRQDFSWQERVLAVDKVHRMKSTESALRGESWGIRESSRLLRSSKSTLGRIVFLAPFLHANDKDIWSAESIDEAYRVLIKREEEDAARKLVTQTVPKTSVATRPSAKIVATAIDDEDYFTPSSSGGFVPGISTPVITDETPGAGPTAPTIPLSSMFLRETEHNSLKTLESLGPSCCDHIITDPPYGIDMEMLNQQHPEGQMVDLEDIIKEHDVEQNLDLLKRFIPTAFTAIRDKGFLIMWGDIMNWQFLYDTCIGAGFRVQRWPLVWHKTSSCINQVAGVNWTKNVEIAIVARKGNATLVTPQRSCVWTGGAEVEVKNLGHPFAKPFALWDWIYSATCVRGAEVLDPFVGRGSSTIPAIRAGLRPRGIECSEVHFNGLIYNLQQFYKSLDPNCTFS